jgi:lipoprotein-anchoring transpeptidase ErfK/SrfK
MDSQSNLQEQLRLGIEAARNGQVEVARQSLQQILAVEPANIPAMLWLAFIAATPKESVQLLEQVLQLDPENERAKSGLRWAQARLAAETSETAEAQTTAPEEEMSSLELRQQLFSGDARNQGRKSVLAHRARRNINPFLLFLLIFIGGAAAVSIGFSQPKMVSAQIEAKPIQITATPHANIFAIAKELHHASPTPMVSPKLESKSLDLTVKSKDLDSSITPVILTPTAIPNATVNAGPTLLKPVEVTSLVHEPASPDEKWIEVNIAAQRVTAWEGNVPVMSFLASTGLPETPTVTGEFHIYWKQVSTVMSGVDYYLPDVPYVMYFYEDYGLHGVYWHHNFGRQMSRGCVNLATDEAKQLFEWATPIIPAGETEATSSWDNPGTLVIVHE